MKITRVIAIAVIAASTGLGIVQAKTLRDADEPAEFPPSSYTGRQYVDSKGCVFIRAGIDGNVTWVPRVSRSRNVVCGFQPSLATARATQPAVVAKPKPKKTVAVAVAPVAKPKPKRVVKTVKPAPVYKTATVPTVVMRKPAPIPKTVVKPKIVAKPAPVRRVSSCTGGSAISSQYMGSSNGLAVRCGPQTAPHVTFARSGSSPSRVLQGAADVTPTYVVRSTTSATAAPSTTYAYSNTPTRVAPRGVYNRQLESRDGVYIPDGYKRVWTDDRLSSTRVHQTYQGKAQMDLIWTKTIPRRLINRKTGRAVTEQYPDLVYPYTSYTQQNQASTGVISTKGQPKVTVSTRSSTSVPRNVAAAASHRYVQAGAFTTREQAEQAAQRVARTGVPTRLGTLTRGKKSYSIVLAGPFTQQSALNAAMTKVRAAGFENVKLRK